MYDIEEAFAAIEEELISSMIRNFDRHRAWEEEEKMEWEQWQALQLRSLEQYKKRNKKRFTKQFDKINKQIEIAIREARDRGGFEQELKILEAIKQGKFTPSRKKGANAEFFKLNDRKIDALIKATVSDMQKAETAILRMANDQYRQVIFNAQVYASSGAGTYEKAVDMATKDFLSAGLNCVEYKNGARHTLKDYADMALRTASKRAYLTGEGEKRAEWGIHTVIVNKRGNPCPKCLPFVGRVFIDDVWSGGSAKDGKYPLLSSAVEAGLYHPRCKDSHTTFFPGITAKPVAYNKAELKQLEDRYINEQKRKMAVNNVSKYKRLAKYSLDPENKSIYKAKAKKANVVIDTLDDKIENEALGWYVSGEGQWVNQYLRGSSDFGELSADEKELIAAIDKATSRETVTESKLFRSVDAEAVFGDMSQIEYENLRSALIYGAGNKYEQSALEKAMKVKGKTITEKGFMSTSKDYDVVADWGAFTGAEKPIVIEFDVPEGIKGKDLKAFDIEGDEQFEVLLAKNSKYEIKDITSKDGNIYIKAELKAENVIDKAEEKVYKKVEKLDVQNFSSAYTTKTEKKNTQKLVDYVNNLEGANPAVLKLYNSIGKLENYADMGIDFKISHASNHAVRTSSYYSGQLAEVKLIIPKLAGDNLAGQVNTTLHENMHLIDLMLKDEPSKRGKWFSAANQKVVDAFSKTDDSIGDEIKALFAAHDKECEAIKDRLHEAYVTEHEKLVQQYLPNGIWGAGSNYKEYDKQQKKLHQKIFSEQKDYESRNIMGGGIGNLQDIYDALSGGKFRDNGTVIYGHGSNYYSNHEKRIRETIANYGSLSVTRPDLVEMLKEDKPELVAALDELIEEMGKKVDGIE